MTALGDLRMTECQKFKMTMVRPAHGRVFAFQRGGMLDMVAAKPARTAWSPTRMARLYYLIGQGWSSDRIAADPVVNTSASYVRTLASQAGVRLHDGHSLSVSLSRKCLADYDAAAAKRGVTREEMISLVVVCAAGCIDAVVDDEA